MPSAQPGNAVLLERIENVRCDVQELGGLMRSHVDSQQKFEKDYVQAHTELDTKASSAHLRIDKIETSIATLSAQLGTLEKSVQPLVVMSKMLGWLAMLLGTSIVALIWGILTHQVQLIFP